MFVAHPPFIRAKVRSLRLERRLSIDEIARRMSLSRSTVNYMVRDIPLQRSRLTGPVLSGAAKGNRAMRARWRALREAAYEEGLKWYAHFHKDPLFRDFVCLYIAEGYKRDRNRVSIANSDPAVLRLAEPWIKLFARNKVSYSLQYHADQDLEALRQFWSSQLDVAGTAIVVQRKSNSGHLDGRLWRSAHGVMSIGSSDTFFRAELQSWIDCVRSEWL